MSINPADDPVAQRVAIHELGHGATYFLIYGLEESVAVYPTEDGWAGQQPPPLKPPPGSVPSSPQEWCDVIAWTYGGWAAVNLAITAGLLPTIPEPRPGDQGFLGPFPADEGCAKEFAGRSGVPDTAALIDQARDQALSLLRPRLEGLWSLVPQLIGRGYVDGSEIAQAC